MDNSINKAISSAIEKGGYNGGYRYGDDLDFVTNLRIINDPLFWQALGKALGKGQCPCKAKECDIRDWWIDTAMQYHYLVLAGGDTEKFWKELLK